MEIKKIAIIKEVNLTNIREQIKSLENDIKIKEGEEKDRLIEELKKGREYLKDVESAPVVSGEVNKTLRILNEI